MKSEVILIPPTTQNKYAMGKGWHNRGGGGSKSNLSSARGYGCVLATCEVNRAKEGAKELLNLLTQTIEVLYPSVYDSDTAHNASADGKQLSMEDALALEIKNSVGTKVVESLQTGVKGLICVKICKAAINPVALVRHIFNNVRATKSACCRHLCRVVPLEKVFFANEAELKLNVHSLCMELFGECAVKVEEAKDTALNEEGEDRKRSNIEDGGEEYSDHDSKRLKVAEENAVVVEERGEAADLVEAAEIRTEDKTMVEASSTTPVAPRVVTEYCVHFKKRNHDILRRTFCQDYIGSAMPRSKFVVNFRVPKVM